MEGHWTGGDCLVMWATFLVIHGLFVPRYESVVGGCGGQFSVLPLVGAWDTLGEPQREQVQGWKGLGQEGIVW